jgi:2'-5' RNA ligase
MTERPWRCFWAVPLPEALRRSLAAAVDEMRIDPAADAGWRWSDPAGWHLTLAFLGGVPADAVPPLLASVGAAIRGEASFTVTTGDLGGFPSGRRARVLWYGIGDPERRLRSLAARVSAAAGLPDAGPFRPHVTLARSRDRYGAQWPAAPDGGMPDGSVDVDRVTLFRSHLGRGPARYEALGDAPLMTARSAVQVPAR